MVDLPMLPFGLGEKIKEIDFDVPRHGDYCGPGWTDGKENGQTYSSRGIDDLDRACKIHDFAYGTASKFAGTTALVIQNKADRALIEAAWDFRYQGNKIGPQLYATGVVLAFPVQFFFDL